MPIREYHYRRLDKLQYELLEAIFGRFLYPRETRTLKCKGPLNRPSSRARCAAGRSGSMCSRLWARSAVSVYILVRCSPVIFVFNYKKVFPEKQKHRVPQKEILFETI